MSDDLDKRIAGFLERAQAAALASFPNDDDEGSELARDVFASGVLFVFSDPAIEDSLVRAAVREEVATHTKPWDRPEP